MRQMRISPCKSKGSLWRKAGHSCLSSHRDFQIRRDEILAKLAGLPHAQRSRGETPNAQTQVYLADTFSEMGLWYACSAHALIGGSFCDVEGHNPWEALQLGCAVMHGPRVANFAADYAALNAAQAARTNPAG
jgi:3-deoxy-D-manno-octulosonic-acid transferase